MELKDWLNSINFTKKDLLKEDPDCIKQYPPFIINRCLSGHLDCVLLANEMNLHHDLDKDMQYSFINIIRKKKRFISERIKLKIWNSLKNTMIIVTKKTRH